MLSDCPRQARPVELRAGKGDLRLWMKSPLGLARFGRKQPFAAGTQISIPGTKHHSQSERHFTDIRALAISLSFYLKSTWRTTPIPAFIHTHIIYSVQADGHWKDLHIQRGSIRQDWRRISNKLLNFFRRPIYGGHLAPKRYSC